MLFSLTDSFMFRLDALYSPFFFHLTGRVANLLIMLTIHIGL